MIVFKVNRANNSFSVKHITRKVSVNRVGKRGLEGKQIEIRNDSVYIQWRYQGDTDWINLIAIADITGAPGVDGTDGRDIELQSNGTFIQWRYVGDSSWTNLVPLIDLKGDPGQDGADGVVQSIVAGSNVTVDNTDPANPIVSSLGGGSSAVDSVNGQTGIVVLDTDDISDSSSTNKYVTAADKTKLANTSGVNTGDQTLAGLGGVPTTRTVNTKPLSSNIVLNQDDVLDGTTYKRYSQTEKTKLAGIETGAEVNNISDANVTDLTDSGNTSLHYHSSDRDRANHTGTQLASTISDFVTTASAAAPIQSVIAGTNVTIDLTDAKNPIISSTGGGSSLKSQTFYEESGEIDADTDTVFMFAVGAYTIANATEAGRTINVVSFQNDPLTITGAFNANPSNSIVVNSGDMLEFSSVDIPGVGAFWLVAKIGNVFGESSGGVESVNGRTGVVTGLAEKAELDMVEEELFTDLNNGDAATLSSANAYTDNALLDKVDKVSGKQLSTEDFTSTEKTKLSGIETGAQVNTVSSVAGKIGAVTLVKGDVGLGNVDNTSDANKPVSTAQQTALDGKVNGTTRITVGTTAPSSPAAGDLWVDTN